MLRALGLIVSTVRTATRSRADLLLEIAALRQQLDVYRRQVSRPKVPSATASRIRGPRPRNAATKMWFAFEMPGLVLRSVGLRLVGVRSVVGALGPAELSGWALDGSRDSVPASEPARGEPFRHGHAI